MRLRKWLRRFLWLLGILFVLIGLFYAVENYRGKKAWERVLEDLHAAGESTDLEDFAVEPVPDSENWGANPLLRELSELADGAQLEGEWKAFEEMQDEIWRGGENDYKYIYQIPETIDEQYADWHGMERFEKWQSHLIDREEPLIEFKDEDPLKDILKVLTPLESHLGKLETGLELPHAVFSSRWTNLSSIDSAMDLSHAHMSHLQSVVRTTGFRSQVLIASDNHDAAFRSLLVGLRSAELSESGPFLIDLLVGNACYQICRLPMWKGLEKRSFSASQLKVLQDQLAKRRFQQAFVDRLRSERALIVRGVETTFVDTKRREAAIEKSLAVWRQIWPDLEVDAMNRIASFIPKGWFYQNFARTIEWQNRFNIEPLASGEITLLKKSLAELEATRPEIGKSPYTFMASPSSLGGRSFVKFFKTQVMIDQVIIACALERYFIDEGKYPDELPALAPKYLEKVPEDRMANAPMRYTRTDDGRYRIWSVGWNGVDDDGVEYFGRADTLEEEVDDWVWQYSLPAQ